jgi:hypothetical protein
MIDVHRQSQNFIIPEFIFYFGKLGDYKMDFWKLRGLQNEIGSVG